MPQKTVQRRGAAGFDHDEVRQGTVRCITCGAWRYAHSGSPWVLPGRLIEVVSAWTGPHMFYRLDWIGRTSLIADCSNGLVWLAASFAMGADVVTETSLRISCPRVATPDWRGWLSQSIAQLRGALTTCCSWCGAAARAWCTSASGQPERFIHPARLAEGQPCHDDHVGRFGEASRSLLEPIAGGIPPHRPVEVAPCL